MEQKLKPTHFIVWGGLSILVLMWIDASTYTLQHYIVFRNWSFSINSVQQRKSKKIHTQANMQYMILNRLFT